MNITGEIFQVGGDGLTGPGDAAIYLIQFGGHAALVDAGCGEATERLFKNIQDCGIEPEQMEYLLITHCHFDHVGGVKGVKERTHCKVVAHELDAPYLELVHRLDRDTSGCLMLAKRRSQLRALHELLREGRMEKRYIALVKGRWGKRAKTVTASLKGSSLKSGERMSRVDPEGKTARTRHGGSLAGLPPRARRDGGWLRIRVETKPASWLAATLASR